VARLVAEIRAGKKPGLFAVFGRRAARSAIDRVAADATGVSEHAADLQLGEVNRLNRLRQADGEDAARFGLAGLLVDEDTAASVLGTSVGAPTDVVVGSRATGSSISWPAVTSSGSAAGRLAVSLALASGPARDAVSRRAGAGDAVAVPGLGDLAYTQRNGERQFLRLTAAQGDWILTLVVDGSSYQSVDLNAVIEAARSALSTLRAADQGAG
jgi:hypothetical protein